MSFIIEDKFERCPAGSHLARCYRIVDLGTQKSEYMGETKYLHKIMVGWEIHGTDDDGKKITMKDGRPFAIFKNYTHSWSNKSNLRIDLQSWRGKPFNDEEIKKIDLSNVLGAWCMLNIIERASQNGKIYSNVAGVSPVPSMIKQNGLPEAVNKNEIFHIDDPDMETFKGFSDSLKKKIESSPEWQKRGIKAEVKTPVNMMDDPSDDIPF